MNRTKVPGQGIRERQRSVRPEQIPVPTRSSPPIELRFRLHRNMAVPPYTRPALSEHRARKSHVNHTLLAILSYYVLLTKGIDQTSVCEK